MRQHHRQKDDFLSLDVEAGSSAQTNILAGVDSNSLTERANYVSSSLRSRATVAIS